jgi:DivIVA domain-containing protein
MARSQMRGNDAGDGSEAGISAEVESQTEELVGARAKEDRSTRRFAAGRVLTAADRERILKDAREVEFPAALRGYDRAAVDRYVERMSRLITELEMSSSPEAAVRHALEEVSDETRDILQRAHETAEEITARSRAKADDRLQTVERESQELREAAERQAADTRETTAREVAEVRQKAKRETDHLRASTQRETDEMRAVARRHAEETIESAEVRARELARSAETVWRERRRLIEDMRAVGEQLVAIGEAEGKRFARFGEEGSEIAELLRDPSSGVAAGVRRAPAEKSNGAEVVPG